MARGAVPRDDRYARRVFIVAAALAFLVLMAAPDLRRVFGHPMGVLGISYDYRVAVAAVAPQAAAAGIRLGDRLDLPNASLDERVGYISLGTANAGQRVALPLIRAGRRFTAALVTTPESGEGLWTVGFRFVLQLLIATVAIVVLMRRPSPATWGFFSLMLLGCAPINIINLLGPLWWRAIANNLYWVSNNLPPYGAIFFALYLLHPGPLPAWRRTVQNVTIALVCATLVASLWHANVQMFGPAPDIVGGVIQSGLYLVPFFAAPLILIATYFESAPSLQQRLRWIIGGFLLSTLCNIIDQLGSQGNLAFIQESYEIHAILAACTYIFIAVPVAYAILKHHIIDVNVAISRATVYTALSVLVVGAFTLVDFFFSHALDQKSAGLFADIALALVLGFSFNSLHRNVDGFVDRMLFRKRHRAEQYVSGVASAMAYAQSEKHVRAMLTHEPVRAFDLSGARILDELSSGSETVQTLCAYLQARRTAVRMTDSEWDLAHLPATEWPPAVAVPVFSHGTLDAIVLYGVHADATDLDTQEIDLLERLCEGAGVALDRLEAEALRREIATLRERVMI